MYHSIIIRVDGKYINTWSDWHLIPSSRPVIAAAMERTKFVTVGGRSGVLDYSQTLSGRPVFDDRTGSIEFYVENDYWDWEEAYVTICETLQGKRVQLALEDNPAHYYEGLLYVDKWASDKGHSKINLKYDLHPTMLTLPLEYIRFADCPDEMTPGMEADSRLEVKPADTFYRQVNIATRPEGIVEVTADGLVRGIQNGTAVIRAECGQLTAEKTIVVRSDRVFWDISADFAGCSVTNRLNKIQNGARYMNILTAPDGLDLEDISVSTSGGQPVVTISTDRRTASILCENVSGDISITVTTAATPHYEVSWKLDCVTATTPNTSVRKGDTVTFKMEGVGDGYLLDTVKIQMGETDKTDRVVWDGLQKASVTLTVNGPVTIEANALLYPTLDECSWPLIDRIARSGKAADYFRVGEQKSIEVRNSAIDVFVLGFNHNPETEGGRSIHFCIGKHGRKNTCIISGKYVNSTATNAGGITGSSLQTAIDEILTDLPQELRTVIRNAPKTVYDRASNQIVTEEKALWLLSEMEVFGENKNGLQTEAATQRQYDYFAAGNWTKAFDDSGAATLVWLRNPYGSNAFCTISTTGKTSHNKATERGGALLGFALGGRKEAKLDSMILDQAVLG
nr:MAG TPA: distal tail protein [Caudoviricetes sp.]